MDFFKGRKIRRLLEEYNVPEVRETDARFVGEILPHGEFAAKIVVESFQLKKLSAVKAHYLLERLCPDDGCELILPLIGDPYDEVRRVAKDLIRAKWARSAAPQLVPYLQSPDIYTRNNAVELLCVLKDVRAEPLLITLFNTADSELKKNILKIFERLDSFTGRRLVVSALNDPAWPVRLAAVKALSRLKVPESLPLLIEKLRENDPQIRKFAIDALGSIGDRSAAPHLLGLLQDDDLIIRQKATDGLIELADASIVPEIIALLRNGDVNVRRCAVEVLRNMKDPQTTVALMQAIKDSDWWVRQIAADSLTALKGGNIVKGFAGLTADEDENVRRCAVEFFIRVPAAEAFDALADRLTDSDWWVRERAITALGRLRDERAIPKVLAKIDDREVCKAIPSAIAEIGGAEALRVLRDLLFRGEKRIRMESMRAMVRIKPNTLIADLEHCLADPDREIAAEAVSALKDLTGRVYEIPAVKNGQIQSPGVIAASLGISPGATVTEAIVVIDLCNSTDITSRYGDSFALGLLQSLSAIVEPVAQRESCRFIKGTGDGFLLTFPSALQAIRFSCDTLNSVCERNMTVEDSRRINLRFAINFGEARIDKNGDRLGTAVSMTFRVEGLKPSQLIPVEGGMRPEEMPPENRILVTENLQKELDGTEGVRAVLVGLFELKGITGLHRIYHLIQPDREITL